MPRNLCTFEHLDDRYSPERGKHSNQKRIVAACWGCNHERNKQREKEVGLETLRAKSGAFPAMGGQMTEDQRFEKWNRVIDRMNAAIRTANRLYPGSVPRVSYAIPRTISIDEIRANLKADSP